MDCTALKTKLNKVFKDFLKNSISSSGTIHHGRTARDVPNKKIKEISPQYVSAFCAPGNCMEFIDKCVKAKYGNVHVSHEEIINGITSWDNNEDYAYGMATSLYERLPTGKCTGDPIADSLAIVTRENCAIMALADGVSWGLKSKLASNCGIYGSITYLCDNIDDCSTTKDIFRCILKAFENAHLRIIEENGTLTTLCVAVAVELQEKDKWCLCVVNVGDSYAYIYNKKYGVKEVTHGSHPIDEVRDMRYSGGALGPADGYNPDLANLTCSMVTLEEGDIVFLCSDGVSDNFDPAVAKFVPRFKAAELIDKASISPSLFPVKILSKNIDNDLHKDLNLSHKSDISNPDRLKESGIVQKSDIQQLFSIPNALNELFTAKNSSKEIGCNCLDINILNSIHRSKSLPSCYTSTPSKHNIIPRSSCGAVRNPLKDANFNNTLTAGFPLTPRERHQGALEQMTEVITTVEFEPINQCSKIQAVDICAQIMNFIVNRTAEKREVLEEHPQAELNELSVEDRKLMSRVIKELLKHVPGKLDHAAIVAYEVGHHRLTPDIKKT